MHNMDDISRPTDPEAFYHFVTSPLPKIHLVMLWERPGILALSGMIEWIWFAPGTRTETQYTVHCLVWQEVRWLVASLPRGKFDSVRSLAKRMGMRVGNGVPTMVFGGKPHYFPGSILPDGKDNMSMFSIENDRGSPIYQNNWRSNEEFRQCETEIVDALVNTCGKLTVAQVVDYLYGDGKFPAPPE